MKNKRNKNTFLKRFTTGFLQWFCHPDFYDEIQGDLEEIYRRNKAISKNYAQRKYFFQVLGLFRLSLMRPFFQKSVINTGMFRSYFILTFRNLMKQKLYSFLNVGGLAVGLTCFILISLFVHHEFQYDRFHEKGKQIFRAVQHRPTSNGTNYWAVTSPALANTLVEEFPEVKLATTVGETFNPLLSYEDDHFQEEGILADENFLEIFSFPLLDGNPETVLNQPNNIVLTESLAHKIFGQQNPMGEIIRYQNKEEFKVTGIMADIHEHSHLQFSYILPAESHIWYRNGVNRVPWYNNGWYTYALLEGQSNAGFLEEKMVGFIDENLADWRPQDRMKFVFQPLFDIHLNSQQYATFNFEKSGDIKYVFLFFSIGLVILLLACVNYTNLAIAKSIHRANEVGMRKALGATRSQLIIQFLSESVLMALLALLIAVGFVYFFMPYFNKFVERNILFDFSNNIAIIPILLGLVILVGLFSGSYPSFYMNSLQPIKALKGDSLKKKKKLSLQNILIVVQYTVSIVLVISSFVVQEQMQFMQNRELGYERDQILTIRANDQSIGKDYQKIRQDWLQDPQVIGLSYSKFLPTGIGNTQGMFNWEGSTEGERFSTNTSSVDYDFLEVYGIEMVTGRAFSRDFASDTLGAPIAIVNEATVRGLGWTPEEAIGQEFGYTDGRGVRTIIGVMKDFHFNSIHNNLGPLVFTLDQYLTGYISVKLRSENLPATLSKFERSIQAVSPYPFTFQFLDDHFDQLYNTETRLGNMFRSFTFLAFLIASLGLFGLAAFSAEQRKKEVGIRKVMGATPIIIVQLLSKDFLKLVFLSFVIGTPFAWFYMDNWLQNFAYRINLEWWIFAFGGIMAVLIAFFTVSYQAIKAAVTNPVKSLKSE